MEKNLILSDFSFKKVPLQSCLKKGYEYKGFSTAYQELYFASKLST
jgi:hypothetical protein